MTEALPLSCVFTASVTKSLPLLAVLLGVFVTEALPLSCVFTASVTKSLPLLAVLLRCSSWSAMGPTAAAARG